MKITLSILAVVMFIVLQGCASITKGTKDTVQVQVSNCSEPMDCTASNKKGSWPFTAPGSVKFKKSDDDLAITCDDGGEVITRRLTPTRGGMIWGNILIGGWIGAGVDSLTDAHWNMGDSLTLYRNRCGQNNITSTAQEAQPSTRTVQPAAQEAQPSTRTVQPAAQEAQPPTRTVQPAAQEAQPSTRIVQPAVQEAQPPTRIVQPAVQEAQGNNAISKPNYIIAPRPSSLRAVDARDKGDCKLIMPITKNAGGTGDISQFIKFAKNSALTEAINHGADSYFIVDTESTIYGASITLEALKCK